MQTKQFSVRTVLTITTGRLLTEPEEGGGNGIGRLYEILNWMTSDDLFTHQLPRASRECEPWLLRWFPELAECGSEKQLERLDMLLSALEPSQAITTWMVNFRDVKQVYDVAKIPMDDHDQKNPLTELIEMVGPDKVMVMPISEEQDE